VKRTLAVFMILLSCASAQTQSSSILDEKAEVVRLVLLDASSKKPIADTRVEFLEMVDCKKAPCPPTVASTQTTARDGSVIVPRNLLNDSTTIEALSYFQRELRTAKWQDIRGQGEKRLDVRAWTLELVPRPIMVCHDKKSSWTMDIANDGSAEVRNDGKPVQFGILHCKNWESAFARCISGTRDAGFVARFDRAAASLASKSSAGPHEIAQLDCSFVP
jgi:hypothetical protein